MEPTDKKLIAVVGATGQQGGAGVRALRAGNQFTGALAPQKQADGSATWAVPLDPTVRSIHMGAIEAQEIADERKVLAMAGLICSPQPDRVAI